MSLLVAERRKFNYPPPFLYTIFPSLTCTTKVSLITLTTRKSKFNHNTSLDVSDTTKWKKWFIHQIFLSKSITSNHYNFKIGEYSSVFWIRFGPQKRMSDWKEGIFFQLKNTLVSSPTRRIVSNEDKWSGVRSGPWKSTAGWNGMANNVSSTLMHVDAIP